MSEGDQAKSYLVESYWPGVKAQEVNAATGRARQAAKAMRKRGTELRFLGSIFVVSDETVFWLFEGSEADVRTVSDKARVPYERILEALRIIGNDEKELRGDARCGPSRRARQ